ncbi:MAG: hypothetical protein RBS19_04905 [Bacteroidales bacterium]|nr:hypothetical protein [Bacteroidales bacterium]MDY0216275.1 hypothetical protein [Bacteroidales bacterium]
MMNLKKPTVFLLITIPLLAFVGQIKEQKISLTQTVRMLKDNKKVSIVSDIYYHFDSGILITHQEDPFEHFVITDSKGEIKIYNPEKNEVFVSRDPSKITDQTLLFYFFAKRLNDFGLRDMGFTLENTEFKDDLKISWWKNDYPENPIKKAELVHRNDLPIYMAYYDKDNFVSRKVYYSSYTTLDEMPIQLPKTITDINFYSKKDSIINQTIFTNITYGNKAKSPIFDLKIPLNAKIIRNN